MGGNGNGNGFMGMGGNGNRNSPSRTPLPTTYANGHISATGDPIHFMFGSRVGFSGTADLMALFSIRTISNGHISASARSRSTYIARIARSFLR